ncbi:MAG: U32 family peptidase, partial [Bacilli bacterium]|nr:U32 family peptidase [Bacilli bacterium]
DDNSLKFKCDGLIINAKLYSTFNDITYSLYEINNIIKKIKDSKKKVLINVNRIIPENEIESFKKIILDVINKTDYLIYSDLAVLNIIPKNLHDKLIYDSKTLICNKEELVAFPTNAFISPHLSYKEIRDFNNGSKKYALDVFGYLEMMYSRRPLLSLVMPRGKVKTNTLYTLKEETRTNSYKIYEVKRQKNNYGTFIYNEGIYTLFKELRELKDNVLMIRINSMFLGDIIDKVISIYNKYFQEISKGTIDNYKEEFYYAKITSLLENNHLLLTRGFLDQESVLLKEATDGEN